MTVEHRGGSPSRRIDDSPRFADYQTVNRSAKEYVSDDAYTNAIEGYFSILRHGIYGVYEAPVRGHLKRYLAESSISATLTGSRLALITMLGWSTRRRVSSARG
jgi:ISXO2-like transposase domain